MDGESTKYNKYIFIEAADDDAPYFATRRLLSSMTKVALRHLGRDCEFRLQKLTRDKYPENIANQARLSGHDTDDFMAMALYVEMEGDWVHLDGLLRNEAWAF
jgi:hypothetical protein